MEAINFLATLFKAGLGYSAIYVLLGQRYHAT